MEGTCLLEGLRTNSGPCFAGWSMSCEVCSLSRSCLPQCVQNLASGFSCDPHPGQNRFPPVWGCCSGVFIRVPFVRKGLLLREQGLAGVRAPFSLRMSIRHEHLGECALGEGITAGQAITSLSYWRLCMFPPPRVRKSMRDRIQVLK